MHIALNLAAVQLRLSDSANSSKYRHVLLSCGHFWSPNTIERQAGEVLQFYTYWIRCVIAGPNTGARSIDLGSRTLYCYTPLFVITGHVKSSSHRLEGNCLIDWALVISNYVPQWPYVILGRSRVCPVFIHSRQKAVWHFKEQHIMVLQFRL